MKLKRTITILTLLLVLAAAGIVHAQATTASVKLTWTDTLNPAGTQYNAYIETTSGACASGTVGSGPSCTKLNATPISGLTYTDPSRPVGSKYFYVVRAIGSSGNESANSNEVTLDLTSPVAPGTLSCTITITGNTVTGTCK